MAVVVAGGGRARAEQPRPHWRQEQQRSPDMAMPRPPRPRPGGPARVAVVVYYLSRNGHLEHPHFMEVALSSPEGLYLRDVIDRLDALRGKGMARMYSWASKRSYRNGFVWHDLTDDDYVHPVAGREYVLKGTERLLNPPLLDAAPSCSSGSQETATAGWERGQRKGAGEYRVYKAEERAADAATQTDDGCRGRQIRRSREETSPSTLIKADGRVVAAVAGGGGSRARASSVLMQLISCGSVSVMPRGVHYRPRPPAPAAAVTPTTPPAEGGRGQGDAGLAVLRRSSFYNDNADRALKAEEAVEQHA